MTMFGGDQSLLPKASLKGGRYGKRVKFFSENCLQFNSVFLRQVCSGQEPQEVDHPVCQHVIVAVVYIIHA